MLVFWYSQLKIMDLVPGVAVKVENVTEIDPLFFEIKKEINEEVKWIACMSLS